MGACSTFEVKAFIVEQTMERIGLFTRVTLGADVFDAKLPSERFREIFWKLSAPPNELLM
jgi:hypothetical protein